jgi:hypothetical protein
MDRFKTNHDLLEKQQREFAKGGRLLKDIFEISVKHPVLSLVFILSLGMLTNALFELSSYLAIETAPEGRTILQLSLLSALYAFVPVWVLVRIKAKYPRAFTNPKLSSQKVLLTLVSSGRSNYKQTPSYNTYRSLLYSPKGYANPNALEKVVLVISEAPESSALADGLKSYIEGAGQTVEIYGITINNKSLLEIQKQLEGLLTKIKADYNSNEIIADYTGGTKDMSIALLKASEDAMIWPIYLNEATVGNHTKYS